MRRRSFAMPPRSAFDTYHESRYYADYILPRYQRLRAALFSASCVNGVSIFHEATSAHPSSANLAMGSLLLAVCSYGTMRFHGNVVEARARTQETWEEFHRIRNEEATASVTAPGAAPKQEAEQPLPEQVVEQQLPPPPSEAEKPGEG